MHPSPSHTHARSLTKGHLLLSCGAAVALHGQRALAHALDHGAQLHRDALCTRAEHAAQWRSGYRRRRRRRQQAVVRAGQQPGGGHPTPAIRPPPPPPPHTHKLDKVNTPPRTAPHRTSREVAGGVLAELAIEGAQQVVLRHACPDRGRGGGVRLGRQTQPALISVGGDPHRQAPHKSPHTHTHTSAPSPHPLTPQTDDPPHSQSVPPTNRPGCPPP